MAVSFALLATTVNVLTAVLALVGGLFYVVVYTGYLKRSTDQNIVIGGAAGAVPPLVGYAAATGSLALPALWLFLIVFLWTPPHFWALALMIKEHYAAANVPMLPGTRGDARDDAADPSLLARAGRVHRRRRLVARARLHRRRRAPRRLLPPARLAAPPRHLAPPRRACSSTTRSRTWRCCSWRPPSTRCSSEPVGQAPRLFRACRVGARWAPTSRSPTRSPTRPTRSRSARFRASDLLVETKPDLTPVTEADRAVEAAIRERLGRERPGDGILGEELGETAGGGRRWIVDPIDGTRNYSRGIPVWATLIALEEDGELRLGRRLRARARAPLVGGAGRRRLRERRRRCGSPGVARVEDAVLCFALEQELPAVAHRCWHPRAYGDFWAHMLVAEGAVDGAIDAVGVNVWDLAAVQADRGGGRRDVHGPRRRRTHRRRQRRLVERAPARRPARGLTPGRAAARPRRPAQPTESRKAIAPARSPSTPRSAGSAWR